MKKRMICLLLALCAVMVLTACQKQETFPNQPRANAPAEQPPVSAPAAEPVQQVFTAGSGTPDYDSGEYNPALEEGGQEEQIAPGSYATPAPTMRSEYAGATPVIIDPIDKPTPTPLPKLKFSYVTYEASALHLSFSGPTDWIVNDSAPDTYMLTNPDPSMDYAATVTIRVVPVNKNYTRNELVKEVKGAMDTIRSDGDFSSFDPSDTATRTFIDGNGVYMAYRGTLKDGRGVAGRVIVNCVDKTLYIMHCSYPRSMADTFADGVYNKIRSTMKIIK